MELMEHGRDEEWWRAMERWDVYIRWYVAVQGRIVNGDHSE